MSLEPLDLLPKACPGDWRPCLDPNGMQGAGVPKMHSHAFVGRLCPNRSSMPPVASPALLEPEATWLKPAHTTCSTCQGRDRRRVPFHVHIPVVYRIHIRVCKKLYRQCACPPKQASNTSGTAIGSTALLESPNSRRAERETQKLRGQERKETQTVKILMQCPN